MQNRRSLLKVGCFFAGLSLIHFISYFALFEEVILNNTGDERIWMLRDEVRHDLGVAKYEELEKSVYFFYYPNRYFLSESGWVSFFSFRIPE